MNYPRLEHLAHLLGEGLQPELLLQKMAPRYADAVREGRIIGEAGPERQEGPRLPPPQRLGDLGATRLRALRDLPYLPYLRVLRKYYQQFAGKLHEVK